MSKRLLRKLIGDLLYIVCIFKEDRERDWSKILRVLDSDLALLGGELYKKEKKSKKLCRK